MKNSNKSLITMIISIGWGLGTISLLFFAGNWLGEGKDLNLLGLICILSSSFTVRICHSFEFFSTHPASITTPVIFMIQIFAYIVIGSIISFVVTRKCKVVSEPDISQRPKE
jgi:hypothetical protein